MSEDVAMSNFTMNTLRGMGTGGALGASNGSQIAVFKDMDLNQEATKNIMPMFGMAGWPNKYFESIKGAVDSVSLNNLFTQIQPPTTPLNINNKVPNLMGGR